MAMMPAYANPSTSETIESTCSQPGTISPSRSCIFYLRQRPTAARVYPGGAHSEGSAAAKTPAARGAAGLMMRHIRYIEPAGSRHERRPAFHRRQAGARGERALGRRVQPGDRREASAASRSAAPPRSIAAVQRRAPRRFPAWAATPPLTRARILFKFLELLHREHDALARIDHRGARQGVVRRRRARSPAASRSSSSPAASRIC